METQEKISALAKYLDIPESFVKPSADYPWDEGNYFDVVDEDDYFEGTYLVVDDDTADDMFIEDLENVIDDVGPSAFNWDYIGGMEDYVDEDWFDEAMRESYESYSYDIMSVNSDEYTSRLLEEMVEANVVSKEDLVENEDGKLGFDPKGEKDENDFIDEFIEHFKEDYNSSIDWFIMDFGDDAFSKAVKENNLLDVDSLAEAIKMNDGRGNSLARYDSEELDLDNGLFAYRVE